VNNENKPGIGGLLVHGACCGGPLLFLLFASYPALPLYGGGLAIGGGVVFWSSRVWSRRRRYREALYKRYGLNAPFKMESHRLLQGSLSKPNIELATSSKEERVA